MASKSKKHNTKDASSSASTSSKSKKSSKSKSIKKEKHVSSKSVAAAASAVFKYVTAKKGHYTTRRIVTKLAEKFNGDEVRAAIESLKSSDKIGFDRKEGGRGKKGAYVMIPLSRKAA